jgi:hypothetical protein
MAAGAGVATGARSPIHHEHLALFIDGQALPLDEFLLQIFQIGIVKMKLAFEGTIGQAPTPPQHIDRLIQNLLKSHCRPSLLLKRTEDGVGIVDAVRAMCTTHG